MPTFNYYYYIIYDSMTIVQLHLLLFQPYPCFHVGSYLLPRLFLLCFGQCGRKFLVDNIIECFHTL